MPNARIYQRPKNAMQSGRFATDGWQLDFESDRPKHADPLTGWAGGAETQEQVNLKFPTREAAIAYAEKHGIAYTRTEAPQPKPKRQAYADNFR